MELKSPSGPPSPRSGGRFGGGHFLNGLARVPLPVQKFGEMLAELTVVHGSRVAATWNLFAPKHVRSAIRITQSNQRDYTNKR